jgi:uncharacterized BrkB/YihY/UPF0761 family membrane protein
MNNEKKIAEIKEGNNLLLLMGTLFTVVGLLSIICYFAYPSTKDGNMYLLVGSVFAAAGVVMCIYYQINRKRIRRIRHDHK